MALRWRDGGKGHILCAATHEELPGDVYIDDHLHYLLAVCCKVFIPDNHECFNGRWYINDDVIRYIHDDYFEDWLEE